MLWSITSGEGLRGNLRGTGPHPKRPALWSVTSIPTGNVGVLTLFGRVTGETLSEGIHLINPLKAVQKLSVQTQSVKESANVPSNEDESRPWLGRELRIAAQRQLDVSDTGSPGQFRDRPAATRFAPDRGHGNSAGQHHQPNGQRPPEDTSAPTTDPSGEQPGPDE